ncbi:MAG: agmatine deiminase family protein [Pseudomonadota bacterium]
MMTRRTATAGMACAALPLGAEAAERWVVPHEGERHERTFMQWPVSRSVYPEAWFLEEAQETIVRIANTIAAFEPVVLLAAHSHHSSLRQRLSAEVDLWDIATDDLWARDSGPLFAVGGKGLAVRSLNFNGWGGRQPAPNDALVAKRVAEHLSLPMLDNGLVGEPGGVEADGDGTLLAHASSWVNANRNPSRRQAEVEALLLEAYGAKQVIWAPGLRGYDITDYHIEALARFVRPGVVVIQMPVDDDRSDPWVRGARATRSILASARDANGRPLDMVEVADPVAPRVRDAEFVPSYVNYALCNGGIVMAAFGDDAADAEAQATIAELHPGREIVSLNADALGWIGGGIHCATQHQPAI